MKISGNTILITGGGSGIGLSLALSFLGKKNKVIIAGRNEEKLKKARAQNPELDYYVCDVADDAQAEQMVKDITEKYPQLNFIINNAGQMHWYDMQQESSIDYSRQKGEILTNLWATIHLCQRFIPHLQKQPRATIMNVSSGIAYIPLHATAVYSSSKAAVHFYTQSLRWQLRDTNISVFELLPPGVHTGMVAGMEMDMPMMTTEKLAEKTLSELAKNSSGEIKPGMAAMLSPMVRFLPWMASFMMQKESKKLLKTLQA